MRAALRARPVQALPSAQEVDPATARTQAALLAALDDVRRWKALHEQLVARIGRRLSVAAVSFDWSTDVVQYLTGPIESILAGEPRPAPGSIARRLTEQQQMVLRLTADGLIYTAIARRLDITVHRVRSELDRARRVLGANSQAHAVHLAHIHGLLDEIPDPLTTKDINHGPQ